jgi:exopolyphosphatase / guanosine-5'-triphosphate,3'-diphosphate pyrophosphatase
MIAVVLNRSRSSAPPPPIGAEADKNQITLKFPSRFLSEHPLTLADLESEQEMLRAAEMKLVVE